MNTSKTIELSRNDVRDLQVKHNGKVTFADVKGQRVMELTFAGSGIRFHDEVLNRRAGDRYTTATLIGFNAENDAMIAEIFNAL